MPLRIPYAPGRAITFGGRPHPEAVKVRLVQLTKQQNDRPHRLTRLASAPGWMLLLVRYDQKDR